MTLTSKGKAFLPIAKELMVLYGEIEKVQKNVQNSLVISSIDSIGTTIVPEVCKELLKEEDVNLTIHTYQTKESYQLVADQEVDVAFVSEYVDMNGVLCEPAFQQEFFVVKPCANPTGVQLIKPEELDPIHEIFQSWGEQFASWHNSYWPESGNAKVKVDSNALLIPFLNSEESWSIIQAGNIEPLRKHMSIQLYRLESPPPARMCYMITSSLLDKYNVNMVKKFKQVLRNYVIRNSEILQLPIQ